jgi:hypothetical protein
VSAEKLAREAHRWKEPAMAVVVRTRRNVSLLFVVWILIGLVVAAQRGYLTVALVKLIVSALLAIILWPLVLLGINMHL